MILDPFCFVSLLVVAQACSKNSNPPAPVLPTDQDASGLYTKSGTSTATFNNPANVVTLGDIKGMVYGTLPNQKFIYFDVASNVLIDGVITAISLTDITTGTAVVYKDGVMV